LLVSAGAAVYSPPDNPGALVRARLDSINRAILKELQADARITNVELAVASAYPRRHASDA
jgi:AsnC-type helix-turn-helix domain